jgi:hypothetical protein
MGGPWAFCPARIGREPLADGCVWRFWLVYGLTTNDLKIKWELMMQMGNETGMEEGRAILEA